MMKEKNMMENKEKVWEKSRKGKEINGMETR